MVVQNRPYKYGSADRREFIVQDSEVAVLAQNDGNGNPVYLGRAKVGVQSNELKWQLRYIVYDANQGITSITWPENAEGKASSDYEFSYDLRATYTYS